MTGIFVVETNDDILLGMVEFVEGGIVVRDGFVGRPIIVPADEIVRLTAAEEHPLIETADSVDYIKVG